MSFKFKVSTNSSSLNVRSGPGTTYDKVGSISKGTELEGSATSNGWNQIASGSYAEKWCCAKYCTNIEEQAAAATADTTEQAAETVVGEEPQPSTEDGEVKGKVIADKIASMVEDHDAQLKDLVASSSVRLFGLPHQLIEHNDPRISDESNLGRMFTETFILDSPMIYLKPGASNYLPGMSKEEKFAYTSLFTDLASGNSEKEALAGEIASLMEEDGDNLRYFDFTQKFAQYMTSVNLLCRIGSVFLGINTLTVPWIHSGNVDYGSYDWRHYTFGNTYNTGSLTKSPAATQAGNMAAFIKDAITNLDAFLEDDRYVQFYVDANASFSESASNSTTQSVVNSFIDQISEMGKEMQFVSGMSGIDISGAINAGTEGVDKYVESVATGDGAIATMLKRLTGTGHQLLAGANFLAPDVWNDSDYGKSYSFTVSLSSPYGCKEAWYINIFVPLMHILAMALPVQTSANTYAAPMLVRAFSPGWFSCDMGIIDSISLEKGGTGDAWTTSGLPSEIKVSIGIKDLYANLALPDGFSIKNFFNNNGLIDFLMVNCGVDLTKTGLNDKLGVMANLFANTFSSMVSETTYGIWYKVQETLRDIVSLYR